MSTPQLFQYEIATAGDERHAVVHARGDLDGNGVASDDELAMEFDPKLGEAKRMSFHVTNEDE